MSIANLQTATYLDLNVKSINTVPIPFDTGLMTFCANAGQPAPNVQYTVSNNIVTMSISIPPTATAAAADDTISFANALPASIRPVNYYSGYSAAFAYNATVANGSGQYCAIYVSAAGSLGLVLNANPINANNYTRHVSQIRINCYFLTINCYGEITLN